MVTEVIRKLRATSSKNEKIDILSQHASDFVLQKILKYTYDPLVIWNIKNIKSIPEPQKRKSLEEIIDYLYEHLIKQKIRGNEAQKIVSQALEACHSEEEQDLIILMLKKDLKCGINKKIINSVFKNLVYEPEYMGAVTYDSKKLEKLISEEDQIILQTKMDGMYVNILVDGKEGINLTSRSGKPVYIENTTLDLFYERLKNSGQLENQNAYTFCGEMIVEGYDRYTSNGLLSRINKYFEKLHAGASHKILEKIKQEIEGTARCDFKSLVNKVNFYLWDVYTASEQPLGKNNKYINRFTGLLEILKKINIPAVQIVNTLLVTSKPIENLELNFIKVDYSYLEQKLEKIKSLINDFYNKNIQSGEEGIIIKAASKPFKNGKPVYQIKMKGEDDCDLKIVGFEPGTPGTKYEKTLGVLLCEDASGKLKVRVGGIDEFWRDEIWNNKNHYMNKIVTVMHNGITKAKDKDSYSLMHPRFIKVRDDKQEADKLETLKKL